MLNLLLLELNPINYTGNKNETIIDGSDFTVPVSGNDPLAFNVAIKYYTASNTFYDKYDKDNCNDVVLIDKYPFSKDKFGARVHEEKRSGIERYEVKCTSDLTQYDHIILVCPDYEPIVLANINFAYASWAYTLTDPGVVLFKEDNYLSVKPFFGDYRGINLSDYSDIGLNPNLPSPYISLSAKSIKCSETVLTQ